MNAQQKKALLKLIAEHVQAQVELSWKGQQRVEDHAGIESDARVAKIELDQFLDEFGNHLAVEAMAVMRLQNEVRLLNRALHRKNRRLRGQYHALKGRRPMPNLRVVYTDGLLVDVPLHISRVEGRSDETKVVVTGEFRGAWRPMSTQVITNAMKKAGVAISPDHVAQNGWAHFTVYKYANNEFNEGKSAEVALDEALAVPK